MKTIKLNPNTKMENKTVKSISAMSKDPAVRDEYERQFKARRDKAIEKIRNANKLEIEQSNNVYKEVQEERKRQEETWGQQDHSPMEWCMILGEEVGEVQKAALEKHFGYEGVYTYQEYRKELIQVAAVAIAMIESYDRNEALHEYDFGLPGGEDQ